ncbi:MAG TPA: NADH-quinone oxidoreductase subunit C [Candidatus Limnocylindrales bacterium]|nr:NADH-quinone oxidoreductase subunit C [Candidatus Limnocylindrales bacterium]
MDDTIELVITPGTVPAVMRTLREDPALGYEILADICGVDTGATMQVVYHLWSARSPDWLRVIVDGLSRDDPRVPSVTFLWNGAEWGEREAYDMFGIIFEGNRDLRRIYMPPDYLAYPLRKDFPLPDDASRGPGGGIRHMELAFQPADVRAAPVLRASPGAGAVIGADGVRLRVAAGRTDGPAAAIGASDEGHDRAGT